MKTGSRTPFEIRLELLQLAQVVLHEKYKSLGISNNNQQVPYPSTEEIITEAEKMNLFVSKTV